MIELKAMDRRDFLIGSAWLGAAVLCGGCTSVSKGLGGIGAMSGFAANPIRKLRVGHVGLGMRGCGSVSHFAFVPGVESVALCDLYQDRIDRRVKWLADHGCPAPRSYCGPEAYKALCESDLDLVYITTPWHMHVPIALYAMEHGKHVAIEVPAAMTIDECWALVETSERMRLHCMQLENCCYGEAEMLCLNLVRKGFFGEIMHAEGAYLHDLRDLCYQDPAKGGYQDYWRLRWNKDHPGNPYPTHGLVPVMQAMNINRGDRFDCLTSLQCEQRAMNEYARVKFGPDSWQAKFNPVCGDMSTTVIRTVNGRTIMVQHDVNSPRPYGRHNRIQGTRGVFSGIDFPDKVEDWVRYGNPVQICWEEKVGAGAHTFFDFDKLQKVRSEYKHPLWKCAGELARKFGGHGGMDFLMNLRLVYCLQNGLPLDMDVYDLAASCSLCELSMRSSLDRGASQDVPDFTRGAWKTAKPLGIVSVDLENVGLREGVNGGSDGQLSV